MRVFGERYRAIVGPLALALAATVPSVSLGQAGKPPDQANLQRLFDDATRLFELKMWDRAAKGYSSFRTVAGPAASKARSVAALREGHALAQQEKFADAIVVLEEGLDDFPTDQGLGADHILGLQDLATSEEREQQTALAARAYRKLLPMLAADMLAKQSALSGLARTSMFSDPATAIEASNAVIALKSGDPEQDARAAATALDLRGRAELISGQKDRSIQSLQEAVTLAGGMTRKIDSLDASVRADLGLAYLVAGDEVSAAKYIAATGVARAVRNFLPSPIRMGAVDCRDGELPTDFAILELSIGKDGTPVSVSPIYATRLGGFADSLATVIKMARWPSQSVSNLNPLQRQTVRIEAHCDLPEVDDSVFRDASPLRRWTLNKGAPSFQMEYLDTESELRDAHAELARRETLFGQNSAALIPVLAALADSPLVTFLEARSLWNRVLKIAQDNSAPISVVGDVEWHRNYTSSDSDIDHIDSMLRDPRFRSDVELSSYLMFHRSWSHGLRSLDESDLLSLRRIATEPDLPPSHAVRRAANLALFFLDSRSRSGTARANYLQAAGLAATPCELYDPKPTERVVDRFFPKEAQRWGFAGWTYLSLDLDERGRVGSARPVYTYPPMIFTKASKTASATFRFRPHSDVKPFRGCSGQHQLVYFG
jgi:tetratricopeptide (TPR) repeat protein